MVDRAILFDLDDTLYPRRSFVLSGFNAVADRVARDHGLPPGPVFQMLCDGFDNGGRGSELQRLCAHFGLPASLVPGFVEVMRHHAPAIHLPELSIAVLRELRADWRIGVLTNGLPGVQKRKVAALGLAPFVDAIVYAAECGDAAEKPAAVGFRTLLQKLGTRPDAAVFVGDDPTTDIAGAARLGMKTIHLTTSTSPSGDDVRATTSVASLVDVPSAAERLLPLRIPVDVF